MSPTTHAWPNRLRRHLTHLGDNLLIGTLNTRVRTELLTILATATRPGEYIAAWADHTHPQGWQHQASTPLPDHNGLTLSKITNR